ncbi:MAG: hypothetical protein JSR47_18435, partial [Proteobacteria bacterium]|nr:hypothetical protein [Pseudomonadota bacterium]
LVAGAAGCAYEEHAQYSRAPGYYSNDYGYYPERHYNSRGDYYRNYKGIDG